MMVNGGEWDSHDAGGERWCDKYGAADACHANYDNCDANGDKEDDDAYVSHYLPPGSESLAVDEKEKQGSQKEMKGC